MFTIIVWLGIVTYVLLAATIIALILFRVKKKVIFYRIHRSTGIITVVIGTVHVIIAILFFLGFI